MGALTDLEPATTGATIMRRTVLGSVHSWDVSTGVDGPGTRFVAFLAGCPLRCLYCQNPDTWSRRNGTPTTSDALLERIAAHRRFISVAGGGVTLSGGEPLMQPRFVEQVFLGARDLGLHTALDTAGSLGHLASDDLLGLTDLVLLDIKSWGAERYRRLTNGNLEPTLRFAMRLAERRVPVWVRFVVVPGHTDDVEVAAGVAGFAAALGNVERVDVLPVHRLGGAKYEALGIRYPLDQLRPVTPEDVTRVRTIFEDHGLATT